MRVVIDGRLWAESGIGRYIRNLVGGLQKINGSNQYYILLLEKDFKKVNFSGSNFHKVLANFKWYGWAEQIKLPGLLKSLKPDLVHFPHFNVPIFYRGRYVVTIHDLIHQHHQTRGTTTLNPLFHQVKKMGYKKAFSAAVKNSSKVIVPSEFVKKQLQEEWGVKGDKVAVTYEGVDKGILRVVKGIREEDFLWVADKFKIKKPYLFYVGNAQPHKNLIRLVRVFREVREEYPDLSLVLSGPPHLFWERIKEGLEGKEGLGELGKSEVIFTGFVSEKEMVILYKNAEAFVMPSLEEGFGIPLLEAMACGCPVVSSNTASLPEVGGDATFYFDPKDEKDMVEKISQVLKDRTFRDRLIKKGEKRYKEFSWERLAKETLSVYTQVG